ncbi:ribose-phosphate diphosphokinase [Fructilactobacillus florum]|uniref:Ribose-phosphate pyrophosphokinase n=1 Tax=Fructilactobacillus florum DSM 22689 = JCM 16035 TaxID=1423745 RepID=A0A0R2CJA4_9LACO|nr:ribose-phosphate pyrophosphokinase [Fructilactobacillus florum]KRM91665.1 ribose-phosphate pyrophosphokinase 1 [Fructilactobacillus florum DSM 22689 = JCM 16035]
MGKTTAHQPIIFALSSNEPLTEKIAAVSGMSVGKATINHFSDGEIKISIDESIRGDDVYLVQSLSDPVNDNFMELMIMIDAVRRTSAHRINVVIPYYGYSRSDRKAKSREPITAKLVASFLQSSAVDRVIALDLHAAQIQGFFDIPVDHLQPARLFADYLRAQHLDENAVVVAPDHNGVARARSIAKLLQLPLAIVDNRDPEDSGHIPESVIGDVAGKNTLIIDDIIVTGHKLLVSAEALKKAGAQQTIGVVTHPVFSKNVLENLKNPAIDQLLVTDSVQVPADQHSDKLTIISVGKLLGSALKLIQNNESTHLLF